MVGKFLKLLLNDIVLFFREILILFPGVTGSVLRTFMYRMAGADIAKDVLLQNGVIIQGLKNIKIGNGTRIMYHSKLFAIGAPITIGNYCSFNTNVTVNAGPVGEISIGDNVIIGPNTVLRASNHAHDRTDIPIREQSHLPGRIVIGDDVWLGANCLVLPNVRIGAHAIVAGGAVVNSDVEEYAVVGGVPAKILRMRDSNPRGSSP